MPWNLKLYWQESGRRQEPMNRKQNQKPEKPISTMLTTGEVARIFNVHASTIRRWSQKGIINSQRTDPRGERRFRREDVAVLYLDRAIQKYLKGRSA
jgi:excisionase family DNA binding protein